MTKPLPKPDVILTHESDLDGFLAGILLQRLAMKLFDAEVRVEAYHYQAWKQRELREKSAWVTDFSFEGRLDRQNWVIIDHHPNEIQPSQAILIHDVTRSAGSLCYELCRQNGIQSPELDRLVQLNNIADLFLEDDPDFVTAGDYANLVKVYNFWNLHALIEGQVERLLNHPLLEVMAVKRRVEDPIGLEWSSRNVVRLNPTVGFVPTIVGNTNLIVHQLLDSQATPYPVLITLFRKANNQVIASLRSRNGEAAQIAALLQGGGHPNASGAVLPRSVRNIDDAVDYLQRVLNPTVVPPAPAINPMDDLLASFKAKQ